MSKPALNRVVADFKCQATGGQSIQLKALRGSNVVLYFYPKDATPGCTTEGQEFRDLHAKFRRLNTQIFGVSKDSLVSHEKFRDKQQFPFHLISDPDETLCRRFDVIQEKSLYGKNSWGSSAAPF
jgi:peroxiredoxin Q/BCP